MTHCRTCGRLVDGDAPTCGDSACVRVDLAASAVIESARRRNDRLVREYFVAALRGENR